MKIISSGKGTISGMNVASSVELKIVFNTKNVTKVSMETSKLEINDDGSSKDGGYRAISKVNQSIKYSFDESLVMIDFSKYPTP